MSTASKITLGSTLIGTIGIVILVHYAQKTEQAVSGLQAIVSVVPV